MQGLKQLAREAVPVRWQVPVKYYYGLVRRTMEAEMALLPFLVGRGQRAIDVGGNRGTYAYKLWKLGTRLEIFEPNPACSRVLSSWASGKGGVSVHPVALSSRDGVAHLHVPVDEAGVEHDASASIEGGLQGRVRDLEVPLRTLDSFGFNDAALLKIDVEGHEPSVLQGAVDTLQTARPALIIEIEQRHSAQPISDTFAAVQQLGYHGYFLLGRKLVSLDKFHLEKHQPLEAFGAGEAYHNNFLFLASERVAAGEYRPLMERWARA